MYSSTCILTLVALFHVYEDDRGYSREGAESAMRFLGARYKREAVVTALRELNRRHRMAALVRSSST